MNPTIGDWLWSIPHRAACLVVEAAELWGAAVCRVWLPDRNQVVRVEKEDLKPLGDADIHPGRIRWKIQAARLNNLLDENVLLAPVDSKVIPLPHQLAALRKVTSGDQIRFLLADEVGLGKTIEAGLIIRELKLRGLIQRILVVAPKGLINQWIAEMRLHFDEEFRFLSPGDFAGYRRIAGTENVWQTQDQVICSIDGIKPLEGRKGWSDLRVAEYNQDRLQDLTAAGWDLIVVDEAHRLGGSSEKVARFQLGRSLAAAAPGFLMLSATPHQGKTDAFHRLLTLLDEDAFPNEASITQERVAPYVVRTEKKFAIDGQGNPLFQPRSTRIHPVSWKGQEDQEALYETVTEYVREGYNRAMREKQHAIGFLMILMQRLVTSSTAAIAQTLERRSQRLAEQHDRSGAVQMDLEDWADMDGQEQLETFLEQRAFGLAEERSQVERLAAQAREVQARGNDVKANALLELLYTLQKDEGDPNLKILLFTEFVPTQRMLQEFLESRGFSTVILNGSMSLPQRTEVQRTFRQKVRILISTDAGGEGLNLQFCHVVINYDLPWNPMRLEQRIGRVDRIGQQKTVRAINFVLEDSVEFRVRDVLEQKLAVIYEEFGVDKTSDVLDSREAGELFEDYFAESVTHPEKANREAEELAARLRSILADHQRELARLPGNQNLDLTDVMALRGLPVLRWLEQLVETYVTAEGGVWKRSRNRISIRWPGVDEDAFYTLPNPEAGDDETVETLSLEHPKVQAILRHHPETRSGMPIPVVALSGIDRGVQGVWSLWRVSLTASSGRSLRRTVPMFVHDDGRKLIPTARHLWEKLADQAWHVSDAVRFGSADAGYEASRNAVEEEAENAFRELRQKHLDEQKREQAKMMHSFAVRRHTTETIGLPEVRRHRLKELGLAEKTWRSAWEANQRTRPHLAPLAVIRIVAGA
jgi:superfamily II DNA or RNA helicase